MGLGKSSFKTAQFMLANSKMTSFMDLESIRMQLFSLQGIGPVDK